MKKKNFIIFFVTILILIAIILVINIKKIKEVDDTYKINTSENNIEIEENILDENSNLETDNTNVITNNIVNVSVDEMEEMKKNINATGNVDIYQVEEEKDGRKILQIKPQVQFNVDLAGIIKQDKPEENEIDNIIKKAPTNAGIWISNQSNDLFIKLLEQNDVTNFYISEDGYLRNNGNIKNNIEKKLLEMIESNKLYIINITGIAYQRDYISGEIVEYPFEEMDPEQVLESYSDGSRIILELSTNKMQKLTNKEILETIVKY